MTPTRKPGSVTREEYSALVAEMAAVKEDVSEAKRMATETHDMVQAIHGKLLQTQPGQRQSLLDRMASVTIDIESGKRTGQIVVALVGFALAVAAVLKWGQWPPGKP